MPNTGVYDPACILSAGVHNFIQHSSYLLYRLSVLWRVPTLSNKVDSGEYKIKSDVNEDVLSQVILGFKQSEQTPFKILRFIEKNNIS
ncbi:hypothetical protein [Morganella psychrotolerans]|uniref:hypothetical protein n=1 Tax=Morganella psychrotolerans TaxID=368603 RepID=UPI001F2A9C82|nr:hypothetical protein [Morganella psychrotolerans]